MRFFQIMFLLYYWDRNFLSSSNLSSNGPSKHGCINETHERTMSHASLWLGRKTQIFSGPNQKPEQLQPFGTGVIIQYPQGLLVLTWKELRLPGSLRMRETREIHPLLVQWQFALQLGGVGGFWKMAFLGRVGRYLNVILIKAWFFITFSLLLSLSWS